MIIKKAAALLAALVLTACAADNGGMGVKSIDLKEKNFKELGRTYYDDDLIYCARSGSGVEFTFVGAECSVTVKGDVTATDSSRVNDRARIAVYVNGERVVDDMIDNAEETYEVFKSDTEQEADVRIIKLSESPMSTFAISDITVNGHDIKPAEDKERFIEFIGDSITCGYGVDDEDRNHHFVTSTEDVTKAYAFKTAEALDADWSMVSFSGYGIISGYSDGTRKVAEQALPQFYEKLGYCWSANGSFVPSEIDWKFKRKPDAVVINLGTNDDSYCKNMAERCAEFQTEYTAFLKTVRKDNPDSTIVCTLGIMGANLYPYIEAAVADFKAETGDENIYTMQFDNQSEADGIAADWHPTEATHTKASQKLAEKLKEVMGW